MVTAAFSESMGALLPWLGVVLQLFGQVHGRHPADAKLAFDFVAVRECSFEAIELIGHLMRALGSPKGLRYGSPEGTARNPADELDPADGDRFCKPLANQQEGTRRDQTGQ